MAMPFLFLVVSLAGCAIALLLPEYADFLIPAAAAAVASAVLFLRAALARLGRRSKRWIMVDGSNVMYWRDGSPAIETVREVVTHLQQLGYVVGVVFDANAGYLVSDRYLDDPVFARMLGLPERQVLVVPKGTPADPFILEAARDVGARIVTNDRYRDWIDDHPELRNPGQLISGRFRGGALRLDFPKD